MSTIHTNAPVSGNGAVSALARPFVAVWNFLVAVGEVSGNALALRNLSEMSDADLAARGTDRLTEIRRIVGAQAYI